MSAESQATHAASEATKLEVWLDELTAILLRSVVVADVQATRLDAARAAYYAAKGEPPTEAGR
ncbi:MAG: hypothetical protein ABMA13_12370 [Chthoniobacteraceae bacterium]